jgi:arylsulfatase A-like enzyme
MRIFLLVSFWLTASLSVAADRPNVLFVLVDDHAYEAISAYGSHLKDFAKTPTIDRLATEGVRFDNFTCCNSICSPSRAAILTGQYSHRNGVPTLNGGINDDSPQYPEYLQRAGYQTWLVGKWHLKSAPKGYDKHMTVKGQGKYFNPTFNGSEGTWKKEGYSTDVYTDVAMDWLKKRDKTKPFLLSLQFKAPHHEYGHAARYDKLLADVTIPEPATLYEDVRNSNSKLKREFLAKTKFHMLHAKGQTGAGGTYYTRHLKDPEPNAMWPHDANSDKDKIRVAYQHMIHKYIRCITGNDDNLKRVTDYLEAEGILDDTIVIYTADQGYWLGQHGFYDKRLILETSVRMPLLIRYPKLIKPGSVNNDLCMNVDLAPTLLELAGLEPPKAMQGRSMVPMLGGKTVEDWRTAQFYAYYVAPHHYGVRDKRYTYVTLADGTIELFDRHQDPDQINNVAGNPEYAGILKEMATKLAEQTAAVGAAPTDLPGRGDLGKKTKRKGK